MLKVMRKHAKYFYVLFVLVILSFIFWGVGTVDKSTQSAVVEVGNERISVEEFWRAFDRMADVYRDIYKEKFDDKMQDKLKQTVLQSLIEGKVLYLAAIDAGITVSDEELMEHIYHDPTFTRDGVFSSDVYQRTLQLNRIKPQYFEAMTRRDLTVRKMRNLIEESVALTPAEVEQMKGDEKTVADLKQSLLEAKRAAAVQSYVEGLMKQMQVRVNSSLIS